MLRVSHWLLKFLKSETDDFKIFLKYWFKTFCLSSSTPVCLDTLCLVFERSSQFQQSEKLFVCFGGHCGCTHRNIVVKVIYHAALVGVKWRNKVEMFNFVRVILHYIMECWQQDGEVILAVSNFPIIYNVSVYICWCSLCHLRSWMVSWTRIDRRLRFRCR